MSDEVKRVEGAEVETEDPKPDEPKGMTEEKLAELIGEKVKEATEKERREWQSRFDKILEEKKTVEKAKETTEQRIERIERERQAEKLSYTRERAFAAQELDLGILEMAQRIVSDNEDTIKSGVMDFSGWLKDAIEKRAQEISKDAYEKKYAGTKPPQRGEPVDYDARIKDAQEKGNVALVMSLKKKRQEVS